MNGAPDLAFMGKSNFGGIKLWFDSNSFIKPQYKCRVCVGEHVAQLNGSENMAHFS